MGKKYYYVYINTNKTNKVLYTGITNNIFNRNNQHKEKLKTKSFTAKYNVNKLIYYESFTNIFNAISREKGIKGWTRDRKLKLIREINPNWKDLSKDV